MAALPFALVRPWILTRDLFLDRERPNLERLRSLRHPERFVWAILPHAARTFSASIALLPAPHAKASAVAYLYCRMLDTYEDLEQEPERREAALRDFARRLEDAAPGAPLPPAPALAAPQDQDARDRAHHLLVERHALVDRVFQTLPAEVQAIIRRLVSAMSRSMIEASHALRENRGALGDDAALLRYCRGVIGEPVLFAARLVNGRELAPEQEADALRVGELLQLANVSRDTEKDAERGVFWYAPLREGRTPADHARARGHLLRLALARAAAYRRLTSALDRRRWSLVRASAMVMLLFTDRYWRRCARRAGLESWPGLRRSSSILTRSVPAFFSRRWTERRMLGIEAAWLSALD